MHWSVVTGVGRLKRPASSIEGRSSRKRNVIYFAMSRRTQVKKIYERLINAIFFLVVFRCL